MLTIRCLPLLLLLLLLLLSYPCLALDPFAMFESELPPPPSSSDTGGNCCTEASRCRRLLDAMGPLRARWATRAHCPARPVSARPAPVTPAQRRQVNSAFMQRHVRRTLKLLHLDEEVPPAERETFLLRVRITELQVLRLRQFLAGSGDVSLIEADSILEETLAESELESLLTEGRPRWLRRLAALVPAVSPELLPLLLATALSCWLLIALLLGRSWIYVISRLAVLMLVVSYFWHWNHLYRLALAERHLQFNAPQGCEAGDRGWTDGLVHYIRGMFSFVKPDEVCREYYTKLYVDPFTEVSPGLAMAETVSKVVFHPAEQFGRALGRFYSALAAEVPTLWLVPLTILSLLFILALIVIACRCLPSSSGSGRTLPVMDPLHVTVGPGRDTVYLMVTSEGEVQPVGEESRRRTLVQRAGPEKIGWLTWTGRGLARSVSAGALAVGGTVSAGTRALFSRRTPAPPSLPPPTAEAETGPGGESLSVWSPESSGPRHLERGDGVVNEERGSASVRPSAAPGKRDSPSGGSGDGRVPAADTPTSPTRDSSAAADAAAASTAATVSAIAAGASAAAAVIAVSAASRSADVKGGGDRQVISEVPPDTAPEQPDTDTDTTAAAPAGDAPSTPFATPVKFSLPPVTSSVSPMTSPSVVADAAGGGDASSPVIGERRSVAAEVAPRGGGDEKHELTASPFLSRIKEVMDTSLEDKEE